MKTRLQEFTEAVAAMREAQKTYFRLRRQRTPSQELSSALVASKQTERVVDWWLKKLAEQEALHGEQPALFGE